MPDQTDKHGPRVDEQLEHELCSVTHGGPDDGRSEGRRQQAPSDDEEVFRGRPEVTDQPVGGLTEAEIERRALLAASLSPGGFPAMSAELVAAARENFASDATVQELASLPQDKRFQTFEEVWEALGGRSEHR